MAKANQKDKKRKEKIKARQQQLERKRIADRQKDKTEYWLHEAHWFLDKGEFDKALAHLDKALRYEPGNIVGLALLAEIGFQSNRPELALKGLLGLHAVNKLPDEGYIDLCRLLVQQEEFARAVQLIDEFLARLPAMAIRSKRKLRTDIIKVRAYCLYQLESGRIRQQAEAAQKTIKAARRKQNPAPPPAAPARPPQPAPPVMPVKETAAGADKPGQLPEINVAFTLNAEAIATLFGGSRLYSDQEYELALAGHQIRFQDSFDTLICLPQLQLVRSLWYQEETAKKVLKTMRGRALLADEVGLGKTIEALIVFKEYILRGMVKSALILTPAPLVSQWRDEMLAKFDLAIPSTDDPGFKRNAADFWAQPFILASINVAKSKNYFPLVTAREYDMVIVDEAHHLKNRTTMNWKLVNSLKKRFLLLLSATPVENDLMELYNIITLLQPGQLKTSSAFRAEFMTSGDPTDPRNREKLKELLGQVMIRNTRAVARLGLPPRFAETWRVEPGATEKMLYDRIDALVRQVSAAATGHRLLLKNLLAAAGSSPRAVAATLSNILARATLPDHEEEIRAILNLCRTIDDSAKNRTLLQIIKSDPAKIIIFVRHTATLEYISDFLLWHDLPHAQFHGGLSGKEKDEQIRIFAEEKEILVTTEVGGEGRNLQFCHRLVNYDLPWNPMQIEQRIGRLHRIGQEKEVRIHNLCGAGSMEDYILYVLDRKINMFELVIGEIDMILGRIRGELDFDDLAFDIWRQAASTEERAKGFEQLATRLKRLKASYLKTRALDEKLFGENYES